MFEREYLYVYMCVLKVVSQYNPPALTRYRVSNFTLDLLIRLYDQPLYDMEAIRPAWYTGHHSAREARDIRCRIASSRSFIACCRKADMLVSSINPLPV